MSKTSEDLLIIFETEAKQWASYLQSVLAGSIPETGICCYDITTVTGRQDDLQHLSCYRCKLLILSRGMLEDLCQVRRFFLSHVLRPESCVVVLLCGVESLEPLLELVPLKGDECLQISSEQDAQEYRSAVLDIIDRGGPTAGEMKQSQSLKLQRKQSAGPASTKSQIMIQPSHVPCENPGELYLILREAMSSKNLEVEFSGVKQKVRVKPVNWNETTLSVTAPGNPETKGNAENNKTFIPHQASTELCAALRSVQSSEQSEFPAGSVGVTLHCGGVIKGTACLHYYTALGEINRLLGQAVDPVNFMCQAFQVSTKEELDHVLASSMMKKMPTGGFQVLQHDQSQAGVSYSEDIPTLLHFAAQHGLKDLASILLQCPGAQQTLRSPNRRGHTPLALAHAHGHSHLHTILNESLAKSCEEHPDNDPSIYELMGSTGNLKMTETHKESCTSVASNDELVEDEEDPYYHVETNNDDYDTISTPSSSDLIANRPPAPAPRPKSLPTKEEKVPFIAQVFQKKMSQGDSDTLYSLPSKQIRGRDSMSSTDDTFRPSHAPGLDNLIDLQIQVKNGVISMDDALERFSDWQRVQRGLDGFQQEKMRQLRAALMSNKEDDDGVYDKINIVHHTPTATSIKCRRGSQNAKTDFYSKPIKGQHSFSQKADKQ